MLIPSSAAVAARFPLCFSRTVKIVRRSTSSIDSASLPSARGEGQGASLSHRWGIFGGVFGVLGFVEFGNPGVKDGGIELLKPTKGPAQGDFQVAKGARLGQEIDDLQMNGLPGGLQVAKAGEDDGLGGGPCRWRIVCSRSIPPGVAGKIQIDDDHGIRLLFEQAQRLLCRRCTCRLKAHFLRPLQEHLAQPRFILDEQDLQACQSTGLSHIASGSVSKPSLVFHV